MPATAAGSTVTNPNGTVSYTATASADSSDVVVHSSGAITAAATLAPSAYTAVFADEAGQTGLPCFVIRPCTRATSPYPRGPTAPKRLLTPRSALHLLAVNRGLLPGTKASTQTGLTPAGLIQLSRRTKVYSAYGVHGLKPANDTNQHLAHDASKHHATQPPKAGGSRAPNRVATRLYTSFDLIFCVPPWH
jgi:hypothetical protein